jgi:hypothetical protein
MAGAQWTQVELKRSAGAEAWVIVRYQGRCFRLPADAAIDELLQGVADGWTMTPSKARSGRRYYRVPADSYLRYLEMKGSYPEREEDHG